MAGDKPIVRFEMNEDGFARMSRAPDMLAVLSSIARGIQREAEALAPVDSGTYKRSFGVDTRTADFGGFDRGVARLENTAPHAAAVEYGNRRARGQHVLSRAAESIKPS